MALEKLTEGLEGEVSRLQKRVVFCIYGSGDFFKDPKQQTISKVHWRKVGKYLRGEWPKKPCGIEMLEEE